MRRSLHSFLLYHPDPPFRGLLQTGLENALKMRCLETGAHFDETVVPQAGQTGILVIFQAPAPGSDPARAVRRLREQGGASEFLAILPPEEAGRMRGLFEAGVAGFVATGASSDEFAAAVKAIKAGGVYVSFTLFGALFEPLRTDRRNPDAYGLTAREREILTLIALGLSNKDVARRLALSVRTVETHRLNIRKKTRATTRRELVSVSEALGLIAEFSRVTEPEIRPVLRGFHED